MILTCPSCETQYFAADESLVGEGRNVRCTACGHQWVVETESRSPATPQAHEVYLARKRSRAKKARSLARTIAWATSAVLFVGGIGGAILMRNEVVAVWPQSASAFEMLGLEVNPFGFEIATVTPNRTFDGTTPILNVSGRAQNVTRITRTTPRVRIGMLDERGREIASLVTDLERDTVGAGETVGFSTVITEPPAEAFRLDVSFVARDGGAESERASSDVDAAQEEAVLVEEPEVQPSDEDGNPE